MADIIIKRSKIHGKGVFAGRSFKKGEIIIRWDPIILSEDELKNLPNKDTTYLTTYNNKPALQKAPAKYVNHSCKPNTLVRNYCDVASRDIKKGEEITTTYQEGSVEKLDQPCNCGTH